MQACMEGLSTVLPGHTAAVLLSDEGGIGEECTRDAYQPPHKCELFVRLQATNISATHQGCLNINQGSPCCK